MSPLNSVPIFEKAQYIKKEHFSNFWTFEIASLPYVPGHYLRKYGMHIKIKSCISFSLVVYSRVATTIVSSEFKNPII